MALPMATIDAQTLLDWVHLGGFMMYPLLLCSCWVMAILLERLLDHGWFGRNFRVRVDTTRLRILERGLDGLGHSGINPPPHVCPILRSARDGWQASAPRFRESLAFAARATKRRLEARLASLAVVSQIAPLIGLLGTVMGMVQAFLAVERTGGDVDPSSLAGGIWEALLTTVFGLCVAIPAYLAWHGLDHLVRTRLEAVEDLTEALLTVHQEAEHAPGNPPR